MAHYDQFELGQDSEVGLRVEASVSPARMFPYAMAHAHIGDTFDVPALRAALTEFCDRIEERQRTDRKTYDQGDENVDAHFFTPLDGVDRVRITTSDGGSAKAWLSVLERIIADARAHFGPGGES